MSRTAGNSLRETVVPLALVVGDAAVGFAALCLAFWLRYASPLSRLGLAVPDATLRNYLTILALGNALLLVALSQFALYDPRLLLRRYQSVNAVFKGSAVWLVAYPGVSLLFEFNPPISRLFVLIAFCCVVVLLYIWRTLAYILVRRAPVLARLRRRTLLLGRNHEARALAADIARDPAHPFRLLDWVDLPTESTPPFDATAPALTAVNSAAGVTAPRALASVAELEALCRRAPVDVLIISKSELPRAELQGIVELCERAYIEWKIVPGSFDIFLSGLRLQTIGRVPVLGVEELAINRLFNRAAKRLLDITGALVGLIVSAPLVVVIAALIKRESPTGPVLFRQARVGGGHQPFTLLKLRSMAPDAAGTDSAQQSTAAGDPRLLRLGAFLRRWNLDELPQFWNVLRGEMSLVGPRPERPYHVDRLADTIPHYLPRHLAKPGMTGWAQVHGLRGDSDLTERIQHDIYYIENWSLWLDIQILLLTFLRWRHPAG